MRPGLVASAFAASAVIALFAAAPASASGPRHHAPAAKHLGIYPNQVATHQAAFRRAGRHIPADRRHAARPYLTPFGANYLGAPFVGGSSVTIVNPAPPASQNLTVVNAIPTMSGIRRPPEAAPLLFIIPADRREARQAERAGAAIRSLGSADTTTARIIVVR